MTKYIKAVFLIGWTIVVGNVLLWIQAAGASSASPYPDVYTISYFTVIVLYGAVLEAVRSARKKMNVNKPLLCVTLLLLAFQYIPTYKLYNTIHLPVLRYVTAPMVESVAARVIVAVGTGMLLTRSLFHHSKSI